MTMQKISVIIRTLTPTVLTSNRTTLMTKSGDMINGQTLRGIFAKRFKAQRGIDGDADGDEDFARLFFASLRYVAARPVVHGYRAMFLPRSIQCSKDGRSMNDMLYDDNPDYEKGFKSKKGQGIVCDGRVAYAHVGKSNFMHIVRSGEKNRLSGSSQDGGIFTYEAVDAGTSFEGEIYGPSADIALFMEIIGDKSFDCLIGRSKFTQYGKCHVEVRDPVDVSVPRLCGRAMYMRLDSPLALVHDIYDGAAALAEAIGEKLGRNVKIDQLYGAQEETAGYNSQWRMRQPSRKVLAAGTVFRATLAEGTFDDISADDAARLFYDGIGIARAEGFGQVRAWTVGSLKCWEENGNDGEKATEISIKSDEVRRIARAIVSRRIGEAARLKAYDDVERIKADMAGMTHTFSRLESLIGLRENLAGIEKRFETLIASEIKDASASDKNLNAVKLGGRTLYDILTGKAHNAMDFIADDGGLIRFAEDAGLIREDNRFDSELEGAAYYDYWLWFFRHARSRSSKERGAK